jgi:hypothetical protein
MKREVLQTFGNKMKQIYWKFNELFKIDKVKLLNCKNNSEI